MTWPYPPTNGWPQQGWQCPICHYVYAPWMPMCTKCKEIAITTDIKTQRTKENA